MKVLQRLKLKTPIQQNLRRRFIENSLDSQRNNFTRHGVVLYGVGCDGRFPSRVAKPICTKELQKEMEVDNAFSRFEIVE